SLERGVRKCLLYIIMRPSCAPGWFYYKSNCYGYFWKLKNWSEAELECQLYGNGAHLASLQNIKEANMVAKYIRGFQINQPVWIGLHDPQKRQQWQWIDGALYLYKSWSGESMGENMYCADISARNSKSSRAVPCLFLNHSPALYL
uniref:Regenerating islet-derived protein 4-like n=1 Tax=Canis lupus dingo TaxID=286419 RepID=A0A8C0L832_CANLU